MPLMNSKYLLERARKEGFAVPAFNIHNLETLQVVLDTAKEMQSPVIIAGTPGTYKHTGVQELVSMMEAACDSRHMRAILHLDHHQDFNDIKAKLDAGIRSVMYDGSHFPFDENVANTLKVAKLCHEMGASLEAELGMLGGQEDDLVIDENSACLTDPDAAVEFVKQTGIDSLAVAIGTAHGMYKSTPKLAYPILEKIAAKVSIPLVLHGASGIPDEDIRKCISMGIAKVNVATELKIGFAGALKHYFEVHPEGNDPRDYMAVAKQAMREIVMSKINVCGSAGKSLG